MEKEEKKAGRGRRGKSKYFEKKQGSKPKSCEKKQYK